MYSEIEIRGFRDIRRLRAPDLRRVNLFVGANGAGKTSLLEAVWLAQGPGNLALTQNVSTFRGLPQSSDPRSLRSYWRSLFTGSSAASPIEVRAVDADGKSHLLRVTLLEEPAPFARVGAGAGAEAQSSEVGPADALTQSGATQLPRQVILQYEFAADGAEPVVIRAVSSGSDLRLEQVARPLRPDSVFLAAKRRTSPQELAERYTKLEDIEQVGALVSSLRVLVPDLKTLYLGYEAGQPIIRGRMKWGILPLPLFGDGAVRLAEMLLAISACRSGLVLVDELENGFYYANLERVWRAVDVASRGYNAQVFATTHSLECVRAAVDAFAAGSAADFRLHRLEAGESETRVVTYDHEAAHAAVELGLEVR